mmetsp:Transcript_5873/g.15621  ORF Transcript_5873/g.15621 Transcript_5873/m.15621 type:complete len:250 (-) Transcript_5873:42-791(-)
MRRCWLLLAQGLLHRCCRNPSPAIAAAAGSTQSWHPTGTGAAVAALLLLLLLLMMMRLLLHLLCLHGSLLCCRRGGRVWTTCRSSCCSRCGCTACSAGVRRGKCACCWGCCAWWGGSAESGRRGGCGLQKRPALASSSAKRHSHGASCEDREGGVGADDVQQRQQFTVALHVARLGPPQLHLEILSVNCLSLQERHRLVELSIRQLASQPIPQGLQLDIAYSLRKGSCPQAPAQLLLQQQGGVIDALIH